MSDVAALDAVIASLPAAQRDNLKYIVSAHPHFLGVHHQKFIVARKGKSTGARSAADSISPSFERRKDSRHLAGDSASCGTTSARSSRASLRTISSESLWSAGIAKKDKSMVKPLDGWKAFEKLAQDGASGADKAADLNKHRLQMLRTVSAWA